MTIELGLLAHIYNSHIQFDCLNPSIEKLESNIYLIFSILFKCVKLLSIII